MCGIYGIIARHKNGLNMSDQDILKQMMLDTVQRGDNSSGLFMTDFRKPTKSPTGVKVLGGPHNIIYNESLWGDVGKFLQRDAGAVIGHGRWATRGKVTAENAHPFKHEHITLVHNGTIHSGVSYAKKGNTDVEVDSHALCVAIAERGILEALSDVRGAYAVIVHDAKEGCLYIARNNDRPLHIYSTTSRHYIMSEGGFLDAIISRYNKREKDQHTMYFKPEQLVKIDLKDPDQYYAVGDIAELRLKKEAAAREVADANRKKYMPPAFNGNLSGKGGSKRDDDKERLTQARELKGCSFKVNSVEPYGTNFRYRGTTVEGTPMFFISDQNKSEYLGRTGEAKIHSYVNKNQQQCLFVRHRDISWHKPYIETREEEPAAAGTFRTLNNKRITATDWAFRITREGCDHCDKTFTYLGYRDVVLTDDDKFLCAECAEEFMVGTKKETSQ